MPNAKLRVVIDTNLLISASITAQSPPDRIFKSWLKDSYILITSQEQLEELKDVSQRKKLKTYPLFLNKITEVIEDIEAAAELVEPLFEDDLPILGRDPKDNYLLATALGGDADYLITGDQDLLVLNGDRALGKLKIISAKDFWAMVKA